MQATISQYAKHLRVFHQTAVIVAMKKENKAEQSMPQSLICALAQNTGNTVSHTTNYRSMASLRFIYCIVRQAAYYNQNATTELLSSNSVFVSLL